MISTVAHAPFIQSWQLRKQPFSGSLTCHHISYPKHHRVHVHAVGSLESQSWHVGSDVRSMYPSAKGKVVLITGGGGSLGGNVSLQLAKLGAKVILADVNVDAVADAVRNIKAEVQGAEVIASPQLDLASLRSVRGFADWMQSQEGTLDVLINNAGANFMGVDPWYTPDGIAGGPQVNVLGPFVLTRLLEPLLVKAKQPRIVNVASVMHRFNEMPSPEVFMRDWKTATYGKSKLAVVMMTNLMHKKWNTKNLVCVCVDPGAVYTGIWKTSKILGKPPGSWLLKALYAPPEDALAVCLHTSAAETLVPGGYYARGFFASPWIAEMNNLLATGILSITDWPVRWLSGGHLCSRVESVSMAPEATDLTKATELWDYCSDLSGLPK